MSFLCSGLQRSDRLLPLESVDVLSATDHYRLHVVDSEADSKLLSHLSFYWEQQREYKAYQQRLLREVHSTRGPVRFVGFPPTRTPLSACAAPERAETAEGVRGAGETSRTGGTDSAVTAVSPGNAAASSASLSSTLTTALSPSSSSPLATAADAGSPLSRLLPPRAVAAWNWIGLVAPYERLLCPSLLFSALLSPAMGVSTRLTYGRQQPSSSTVEPPASPRGADSPPALHTREELRWSARWSAQTCRMLWALHECAAAFSLPAQEVYVLCAGTLAYLDVVLTYGGVWAELQGLWGTAIDSEDAGDKAARVDSNDTASPDHGELAALKAFLGQPPQTYASAQEHLRVLLEAITYSPPVSPYHTAPQQGRSAGPRPLLPWLKAALAEERWTATPTATARADTTRPPSTSSSSSSPSLPQPISAVAQVLTMAGREWLARRAATVTATAPTGTRAVPLPMRDLHVSCDGPCKPVRQRQQNQQRQPQSTLSASEEVSGEGTHTSSTSDESDRARVNSSSSSDSRRAYAAAAAAAAVTAGASLPGALAFDPYEPHDTPREQHPFRLPPLPQDPALLVFATVWRRTLQRCVADREVVRHQLRQVVLGQAGQRCEELLREVRRQAAVQEEEEEKQEEAKRRAVSSSTAAAVVGGDGDSEAVVSQSSSLRDAPSSPVAASAPPQSHQQGSPPPPLLLLTEDATATSFRVVGPRSGEWVVSRTGAWEGFRGQLFRCVGSRSHPPAPLKAASPSGAVKKSTQQQQQRQQCAKAADGPGVMKAPREGRLVAPVMEPFVDGALELEGCHPSSTTTTSTAAAASSFSASAVPSGPLYTAEELADRLCRLGAALPRYATEMSGDRLRPADVDYAREVLQRQCLPLFLACERRGIQQWSLRSWMKGVSLTMLDKSGTETRVTTPAKLMEVGRQQLQAYMGGNGNEESAGAADTAAALRLVLNGGLGEALAFLEHVRKRKERALRWLPVTKVSRGGVAAAPAALPGVSLVSFSAVEALLLRRSEESALFSIFQCHPLALPLSGCGVQRLALPAGSHKGASSLLLVRTCGVVAQWEVEDCYEAPRHRRLRTPKRLVTAAAAAASGGADRKRDGRVMADVSDVPPPEIGGAVERLTLRHVRGMLQYYARTLRPPDVTAAETATRDEGSRGPAAVEGASVFVDQPLSLGVKRTRSDEDDQKATPHASPSSFFSSSPSLSSTCARQEGDASLAKSEAVQTGEAAEHPTAVPPPSQTPPLTATAAAPVSAPERTALFPIDRAVALYVLRRHPQYYTHVAGCGIREIYVTLGAAAASASPADAAKASSHAGPFAPQPSTQGSEEEEEAASSSQRSEVPGRGGGSQAAQGRRPVLVVERICGQRVEVDVQACYDQQAEGCPLRSYTVLV